MKTTYACKCREHSKLFEGVTCRKCGQVITRQGPPVEKINWWAMIPAGIGAAIFILGKIALVVNYMERTAANHLYGH